MRLLPLLCTAKGLLLSLLLWGLVPQAALAAKMTAPVKELLATAYPVGEVLRYEVTWMGIRAGELTFEVKQLDEQGELLAITIRARTVGMLGRLYPVQDDYRVVVEGEARLPSHYRISETKRGKRQIRSTVYDQQRGRIVYQRRPDSVREYRVDGPVHNEFSAFYATRVMPLLGDEVIMIPTFADERRNEVKVEVGQGGTFQSLVGRQEYLRVQPRLDFVGLYEKAGDPEIWLTKDHYRIPVRVRSQIAIGSLVATLTYYKGPAGEFGE
ncbi:DUF3108 domain-containing protein [Desulfurivibrio alkaliphilus]|uniref:DUF3108 domain-containing protein n=1 Tax=Desulfurivibrio alkaliphilus (strain DSM 19089 / UNIQEM U267 / AHT2) TaxID=589865 RepID=D6Z165_DESAT|nr:DUF3108 domain-containing protein [Desulfurivibrio alkaliphilus]ADH85320.1 hypothetical protein DaAHT2_0614 [Desulfurivibrio alkaliphilus AHT 2]